jgi:hypothetical protein
MASETSVQLSRNVSHAFTFCILFIVYFGVLEREILKNRLLASQ